MPLNIEGLMISVGCIIMDNPPFDLLLGRAFMEKLQGKTDWSSGQYQFRLHGHMIGIDAVGGQWPRVTKIRPIVSVDGLDAQPQEPNATKELSTDDEAEEQVSDESDLDDDGNDDPEELHSLIARAREKDNDAPLPPITMEELLAEQQKDNIASVFLLMRVPKAPDFGPSEWNVLSIHEDRESQDVNKVVFSSDQYGFCLEAPRCRDIMSDTPVKLVPGLEEHKVYVGDLPEVDQHMAKIQEIFQQHKGCFPLPGEMS